MPIEVIELHHQGIRIGTDDASQSAAREFYAGLLGLTLDDARPEIPGMPGFWAYVGDSQATQLHIMGAQGRSSRARSDREDPTLPHVALAVADIDAARRELEARGIWHWTAEGLVGENSDQVFVQDPSGNVVELHQIGTCRCNRRDLPGAGPAIEHRYSTAMPRPGAPFSQVVLDDHYAHLAGIVAADFPEGHAVLGDVAAETRAVLGVIKAVLAEVGLDLSRVVRADVHLADLDDFDAMDSAYRTFFEAGRYPARTTTESRRLFGGSRVEITCMARRRA